MLYSNSSVTGSQTHTHTHTHTRLITANGNGLCLQEGTIRLHLNNNDGVQHIFILDNCLYHPNSTVNLLSTRRLAEKIINEHGNPDKQTQIESGYSTHVLTWSFGSLKQTFPTPLSGLPELLFDKGFQAYKSLWRFHPMHCNRLPCIQIRIFKMHHR